MQLFKQWLATAVLALVLLQPYATANAASAYHVSVDTSSLFGGTGFIDMQFNPGDVAAAAAVATVTGFSGDAILSSTVEMDGNTSGALPGSLTFINDTPFNAVLQSVLFGNTFDFTINFSGAYETAQAGSGTRFSLALLDAGYDTLASVDLAGTILQFELMPGGTLGATTFAADASGAPSVVTVAPIPLPAALPLLVSALAVFGFASRRAM